MAKKIGTLSGLEAFLATCDTPKLQPHEWTAKTAHDKAVAKGMNTTHSAIRSKLQREAHDGKYATRRVLIDGAWTIAYSEKT